MAASKESLKKVKALDKKRRYDPAAQKQWDKLVKAYDRQEGGKTPSDVKGEALEKLIPKLAVILDKSKGEDEDLFDPCSGSGSPCGEGGQGGQGLAEIDIERLAERVFDRLVYEARVERERTGWAA